MRTSVLRARRFVQTGFEHQPNGAAALPAERSQNAFAPITFSANFGDDVRMTASPERALAALQINSCLCDSRVTA